MKKKVILAMLMLTVAISGCAKSDAKDSASNNNIVHTNVSVRSVNVQEAINKYFESMADDDTELSDGTTLLGNHVEDSSEKLTEADYKALYDAIEINEEPVSNGLFLHLKNNNPEDVKLKVTVAGVTRTVPWFVSNSDVSLFFDVKSDALSDGYVVSNVETGNNVINIETSEPEGSFMESALSYPVDIEKLSKDDLNTYQALIDKGYIIIKADSRVKDFTAKYYSEGNLVAGGCMDETSYYHFDNSEYAALKAPDTEYDTAEVECYF